MLPSHPISYGAVHRRAPPAPPSGGDGTRIVGGDTPVPSKGQMLGALRGTLTEAAHRGYETAEVTFHRTNAGRVVQRVFDVTNR